jgi:hypothetical protein
MITFILIILSGLAGVAACLMFHKIEDRFADEASAESWAGFVDSFNKERP